MDNCKIVAISRTLGAGGEEVGRTVAERMGFRYADTEIIIRAAEAAGVSADTVAQAESTPGLITRILEAMGRTPMATEGMTPVALLDEPPQAYEGLIERMIRETAQEGNVVIVSHAASIPLAGTPGLLRVLATAPEKTRAARVAEASGSDPGKAAKTVRDSDKQRREYIRRFYGVDQEQPTHYDIVLNTEHLCVEDAVRLILTAAGR